MTNEPRHQATARVTLEVEIKVNATWGPDCSIQQVHQQAAEEAIGRIRNATSSPMCARNLADTIKVVGEPKVTAILVNREA